MRGSTRSLKKRSGKTGWSATTQRIFQTRHQSYFIGNPVTYKSDKDIKALTDALETAGADEARRRQRA